MNSMHTDECKSFNPMNYNRFHWGVIYTRKETCNIPYNKRQKKIYSQCDSSEKEYHVDEVFSEKEQ